MSSIDAVTRTMWAITTSMYDVQALCGLSHPLILTCMCVVKKEQVLARALKNVERWKPQASTKRLRQQFLLKRFLSRRSIQT